MNSLPSWSGGSSGRWAIATEVTASKDHIQCICLMTGDVTQLSVQASFWEFAVCLNIMLHTLTPGSGP